MKFLINITQVSSCPSPSWVSLCDALDIPVPFHQLSYPYSTHRSRPPKSDGPNTSSLARETPSGEAGKNGPSTFLPNYLCSGTGDIRHAYGCGSCPQHPSEYGRSQNRIAALKGLGNHAVGLRSKRYGDILSPKLYDTSDYLLNVNFYDIQPSYKTKIFIETKVAAIKLQGFNH